MLLALAVILMQAPAVPSPTIQVTYTSSSVNSVVATAEKKSETKPEAKADAKDAEKKSADSKDANARMTTSRTLFPAGSNVSHQPGQTVVTPIDGSTSTDSSTSIDSLTSDDAESISSSRSFAGGEPVILAAPIKKKRPESAGMGVPKMWFVLGAMEHGAATFDAWSTRRNIIEGTMHEADPLMRPFANSGAMYAAVQVAPVLFDLLSKQMMRNSHSWVRKSWWVPQTASTVTSILSGAHNVAIH